MQNPKPLLKKKFHSRGVVPKVPIALAAACLLGGRLSAQEVVPVDVGAGSNLYTFLNNATAASHTFNLLGDVTLGSTFLIDNDRYLNIVIEGNNHTITRTAQNNIFWVHRPNTNLTIENAIITTSATGGNTWGAISIDTGYPNATINLNNTTIRGNRSAGALYSAGLTAFSANTVVNGNVTFDANHGIGLGAGGTAVAFNGASLRFTGEVKFTDNTAENRSGGAAANPNATLTFDNKVSFERNSAAVRAGALWVDNNSTVTFKDATTFDENNAGRHGGAINIEYGGGRVVFENDVVFSGNYAKGNDAAGARGGAVSIGTGSGTVADPQLQIDGRAEFTGNYAWGTTQGSSTYRNAYGGAIAMTAVDHPITDNGSLNNSHVYRIAIEEGIFTDNYAYAEGTAKGYGGAIFSKNYQAEISFGSGSEFIGNAATGEGGAIYFNQGTINLDGDITFEGNRQNATFTVGDTLTLNEGSGSANAIYFSAVNNVNHTATLNLTTRQGQTINFRDPIESAAGRSVIVRHSGEGEVRFRTYDSDVLAQTDIDGGSFILEDGAKYGRVGTVQTSYFNITSRSVLKGDNGSTLRASIFTLDGWVESTDGVFYFEGGDINLSDSSVFAIHIFGDGTNSSFDVGGNAINLNGAELRVMALNYVPSQDVSDSFTIVANIGSEPITFFAQGDRIMINGAEFEILYEANRIILNQLNVPEPSTYALILAVGCIGFAWVRRQRKGGKSSHS